MIQNVCVFCGSRDSSNQAYQDTAIQLGTFLGQNDFRLVYGGGRLGLMGLTASATLKANGYVIGIIPDHLDGREGAFHEASELHIVDSMHTRKMKMSDRADAFVVLPGGFGTLDEFFEIFTWRQIGLHNKPIFLLNIDGYWDDLIRLFHHVIDTKFADTPHRDYLTICKDLNELKSHLLLAQSEIPLAAPNVGGKR